MPAPSSATAPAVDGFEQTFQVDYLAAFLLTRLLIDKLAAAGAAVIQTSSIRAHMSGMVRLDALDHDRNRPTT